MQSIRPVGNDVDVAGISCQNRRSVDGSRSIIMPDMLDLGATPETYPARFYDWLCHNCPNDHALLAETAKREAQRLAAKGENQHAASWAKIWRDHIASELRDADDFVLKHAPEEISYREKVYRFLSSCPGSSLAFWGAFAQIFRNKSVQPDAAAVEIPEN